MYSLEELATALGIGFSGDPRRQLRGLATLSSAGPEQLAFLANSKYLSQLAATRAGAVILHPDHAEQCPVDCLLSEHPYLTYVRASRLYSHRADADVGIHASAEVHADARIGEGVAVGPRAVIEAGAQVGDGARIGAGCYIGHDSLIGNGSRLAPGVVVYHQVSIGRECVVHGNAVIGGDGFGFAPGPEGWEKIEQLGGVVIGDSVEIGACTTIDRGALDDTVIADGVIIDNLVQVGHNCRIGKNTAIAGCTGLAGSTIIGENCTLAGGVGVLGHLEICDNVHVTAMTMVTKSILEPGSWSSGTPMAPTREWKRSAVRFAQLEAIQRRLARLEQQSEN